MPGDDSAEFTVIGGGIGGLVVARCLARAGRSVLLIEESDHLGGTVTGHTVGGITLDAGAESFASRGGTVAALAAEVGLGDDLVTPAQRGAWLQPRTGAALPLPEVGLVGIPGAPLTADVWAVIGTAAALRAQLDGVLPCRPPPQTLGELVRQRMGARVLELLVAPVVYGVYSVHPDDLPLERVPGLAEAYLREGSLAAAVRTLRAAAPAGSAVEGIRGGVHRLVHALAADLAANGVAVELGRRALPTELPGTVIVAAPGVIAPELVRPVTIATLVVDAPELDAAPRGTGVLVATGAAVQARALTHATAKWQWLREAASGKHVLRLSYDTVPAGLAEVARVDAQLLLGASIPSAAVVDFARVDWRRPRAAVPAAAAAAGAAAGPAPAVAAAAPRTHPAPPTLVGEAAAGTGIAAIVAHAQATADRLLARSQ